MPVNLTEVFGVGNSLVKSYVERTDVDNKMKMAIQSDRQIVVYGASKQGKTALVSKYVDYDDSIVVRLAPNSELAGVYHSILRQAKIIMRTSYTEGTGSQVKSEIKAKIKAAVALFGSGELEAVGGASANRNTSSSYQEIAFNLELAQDIGELLQKVKLKKMIILENFHYLSEEVQKQFSYDLRTFQEIGIRFIILGVWREKDRMSQYNGDLLDRIEEIAVEPWEEKDFFKIAMKGSEYLNIIFSREIIERCSKASFGSVGVFQELLKEVCCESGVLDDSGGSINIDNPLFVQKAIKTKTRAYSGRHQRALESLASGLSNSSTLFLNYYLVKVLLLNGYDYVNGGISRETLHQKIKDVHHSGDDIKVWNITSLLNSLAELQHKKDINPPILGYDNNTRLLQVVDSTFNFFMKHANLNTIIHEIANPLRS
ncbi:hypothetical protein [Desulfuromonas sp. TF]|uniref:hypothetical protein n=1 Tax=Desulfuromonas sp. TF TaxID=1232410 RepID=UPI0003F97336|nr:hypothetical protein [Desulfuromonas sp. TF]